MEETNPFLFCSTDEIPGGPGLKGMRCGSCGHVVQPSAVVCPLCGSKDMDVVVIGHRATLLQYSEVYQDSDIFKAPYTIGLVQVTEGPKLFVPIKSDDPEALQVGASMTFCLLPMPDRNQINFAYTPEETK